MHDFPLHVAGSRSSVEAEQHLLRYPEFMPQAPERDQVLKELSRLEQIDARK
jgi:hypothetical protein